MMIENLPNYQELKKLILEKRLDLFFIVALPRTGSTALERSLTESSSINGQIHEPFTHRRNKFDEGCNVILEHANDIIENNIENGKPSRLLIKVMSYNLLPENFELIAKLTNNFLILVRHPVIQMESLLKAYRSAALLEDITSSQDLKYYEFLAVSQKDTSPGEPGWNYLYDHVKVLNKRSTEKPLNLAIVDGQQFYNNNSCTQTLRKICELWNLEFELKMSQEYSKGSNWWASTEDKLFFTGWPENNPDPFIYVATKSKGWKYRTPRTQEQINETLNKLPSATCDFIECTALNIYEYLYEHPSCLKENWPKIVSDNPYRSLDHFSKFHLMNFYELRMAI